MNSSCKVFSSLWLLAFDLSFVLWPLYHPAHMVSRGPASAQCINRHTGSCKRKWIVCVNSCLGKSALWMSGSITFAFISKRVRKWAKNRDTGEICSFFWRGAKDPAVPSVLKMCFIQPQVWKTRTPAGAGLGQLLALGDLWRMRQTQQYGILTREGKSS